MADTDDLSDASLDAVVGGTVLEEPQFDPYGMQRNIWGEPHERAPGSPINYGMGRESELRGPPDLP